MWNPWVEEKQLPVYLCFNACLRSFAKNWLESARSRRVNEQSIMFMFLLYQKKVVLQHCRFIHCNGKPRHSYILYEKQESHSYVCTYISYIGSTRFREIGLHVHDYTHVHTWWVFLTCTLHGSIYPWLLHTCTTFSSHFRFLFCVLVWTMFFPSLRMTAK